MSWQALDWADSIAHDQVSAIGFRVLVKLANVAAPDGTRAFRSKQQIADELQVSGRTVQRALTELRAAAFIRPGDQRLVQHLRADKRPTVYDLNMPSKVTDTALFDGPERGDRAGRHAPKRGDSPGSNGETTGVLKNDPRTKTKTKKEPHLGERARVQTVRTFESVGDPLPLGYGFLSPCLYEHKHKRNRNVRPDGACIVCEAHPFALTTEADA